MVHEPEITGTAKLDNVSIKILEDAEAERQKILESAAAKAGEIIEAAEKRKLKIIEEAKAEAGKRYLSVYNNEIVKAKSENEQKLLGCKIRIIDGLIEKARQKLVTDELDKFLSYISHTLKKLDLSKALYQTGSKESILTDSMIKKIAGSISLEKSVEEPDFEEGIKLIDGRKEYLISASSLIKDRVEDIRMEAAAFLFEKE